MDNHGEKQSRGRFAGQLTAHRGRVFAWVMHRVGADRAVAEDVTQDCFVRVWETRQSNPPPPGALHTYLLKTAQNLLRDRFRREAFASKGFDPSYIAATETTEEGFLFRETAERLVAEAALMPFLLRETLRLRVEEGMDYPSIASWMNCPVGTVKSRLHAARNRLRAALEAQEILAPPPVVPSVRITKHLTVSPPRRGTTTVYEEQKTMATLTDTTTLQAQVQAMEARLSALESTAPAGTPTENDSWDASARRLGADLKNKRKQKGSAFALGLVHAITQSADGGTQGTALGIRTFESIEDLPDDQTLMQRLSRMQQLTSDPAIPRVFRHLYALRFGGKEMRATAEELAKATGTTAERITDLLKPLVADRTLMLLRDGDTGETYEWEGNDVAITTLLLT